MFGGFAEALGLAFPWFLLTVMLLGLFGLVVPVFPGNVVIWAAALVFGLADGFTARAWWFFVPISLITLAAVSADNILMGAKAKQAGASWLSIGLTLLAAFIVSIFFTPIAGLAAAIGTLFLVEYIRNKWDAQRAWQITSGLMIGCGWAFIVRFGLGTLAIGLYLWWALAG